MTPAMVAWTPDSKVTTQRATPGSTYHAGWTSEASRMRAITTMTAAVGEPAPEDATDEKTPAYQPQWDPARQAYLQWDPRKQQWLQYDEAAGEWHPIG